MTAETGGRAARERMRRKRDADLFHHHLTWPIGGGLILPSAHYTIA
ncbi:hypothetical protein [Xanthomonas theicola]|nr:hypothetical protein [Xanthomonas theicola]QNH26078.1 hypothetical protein G4Q83_16820 [Xanthomonas theicola]